MKEQKCPTCGEPMTNLGNVSGLQYLTYPVQWDDVWVCDKCKTKKTVRECGVIIDPTGGRNLGDYKEQTNVVSLSPKKQ